MLKKTLSLRWASLSELQLRRMPTTGWRRWWNGTFLDFTKSLRSVQLCVYLILFFICNVHEVLLNHGWSSGSEEALQPHHWRDVSLHVAPSEDQQQNLLHRRTGRRHFARISEGDTGVDFHSHRKKILSHPCHVSNIIVDSHLMGIPQKCHPLSSMSSHKACHVLNNKTVSVNLNLNYSVFRCPTIHPCQPSTSATGRTGSASVAASSPSPSSTVRTQNSFSWKFIATDNWWLSPSVRFRKLPVSHIRWRGPPDFSQSRGGLRDEHALCSLQRSESVLYSLTSDCARSVTVRCRKISLNFT